MKKSTHELIGECTCTLVNSAAEYGITKVTTALLENAIPGGFGKFTKFAVKLGIGLIYEATVGEKVFMYLRGSWNVSTKMLENAGMLDDDDPGDIYESESEEVGA